MSPVIGVILMVAITVILAAVIGTFVLDLGQSAGNAAPQASLSVSPDPNTENVTIEHTGGDSILSDQTRLVVEANDSTSATFDEATSPGGTLSVGGSVEVSVGGDDGLSVGSPWSGMSSTDSAFTIQSGQQITVTVIDVESQRQIFRTSVTA